MEERKAAEESAKKALDDGSVKGLIISRDYTNVGEGVAIQNIVDGVSTWTIAVEVVAVVQWWSLQKIQFIGKILKKPQVIYVLFAAGNLKKKILFYSA